MNNLEHLKKELHQKIDNMNPDEMYHFILDGEVLCKNLCRHCVPLFGECEEVQETDLLCKERFRKWCDLEQQ